MGRAFTFVIGLFVIIYLMKNSRSRFIDLRGLRYHIREWGEPGAPKLFMLHGWMDVSASFQFMVDALAADWHVIAPDWRGFGATQWSGADTYWFPDYCADLDALLRHFLPEGQARLVGHSMGGNAAMMYAGIRPARIERVVALDAFGLAPRLPEEAPERYAKWLDELAVPAVFQTYADYGVLAERLRRANPRLSPERAAWLARHHGEDCAEGVRLLGDPAHRGINPVLYRRAEAEACWRQVSAPVLWVEPVEQGLRRRLGVSDELHAATKACFRDFSLQTIADTGHNLHLDQPEAVARIVERFLLS